ncbi:MAG: ferredoxin Fer [archaeon]
MPSPFEVLGVDFDADEETIRNAYRRQVKEHHPDHGGSISEFRAVQDAYEKLLSMGVGPAINDVAGSEDTAARTAVEYLDYDVLSDRGWSLSDPDLFDKARRATLNDNEYGRLSIARDTTLLDAVEHCGLAWPYSCRGGACANCAVAIHSGELSQPVNHILPESATERGIRLSCVGQPITTDLQVVFNVKHLPSIADLRLPPRPVDRYATD